MTSISIVKRVQEKSVIEIDPNSINNDYNWLAVDKNGSVWAYTHKPIIFDDDQVWGWNWRDAPVDADSYRVNYVGGSITNWKDTLVKIEREALLPVGTVIVADKSKIPGCVTHELISGIITEVRGWETTFPYTAEFIYDSVSRKISLNFHRSAIVVAYNPVTKEKLI